MDEENPYTPPTTDATAPPVVVGGHGRPVIGSVDHRKIEAIIKDASQFWLAIILCICCSGIGAFIVPIWYAVRLVQWRNFAAIYPGLVDHSARQGSFPARFTSSQWKLIVGLVFGCLTLAGAVAYVALLIIATMVNEMA